MNGNLIAALIGMLIFIVGYRIGFSRGRGVSAPDNVREPKADISNDDIRAELRAGRKIEAITRYRRRSGAGLKQAKQAVEAMDAAMGHVRSVR